MSNLTLADLLGAVAALCMLSAFNCKNLIRLRCISLTASAFFIAYAAVMGLMPILVLHAVLLPLNAMRLCQGLRAKQPNRRNCGSQGAGGELPSTGVAGFGS